LFKDELQQRAGSFRPWRGSRYWGDDDPSLEDEVLAPLRTVVEKQQRIRPTVDQGLRRLAGPDGESINLTHLLDIVLEFCGNKRLIRGLRQTIQVIADALEVKKVDIDNSWGDNSWGGWGDTI